MGTKGTCKTSLATLLVSQLELLVSEGDPVEGGVMNFNLAAAGSGLDVSEWVIILVNGPLYSSSSSSSFSSPPPLPPPLLLFLLLLFLQTTLKSLKDHLPRKIRK